MIFLFHGFEDRQEQTVQNPCTKEGVDQLNTFWNVVGFSVLELLKYLHSDITYMHKKLLKL